jgi:hypothetical protein
VGRLRRSSMPLREKSVKARMITYKNARISIFVGNNIEYYLTNFLQNIEFGCFCRNKLSVFNFFVSQTVKNMLPKQKNTYKNLILQDFVGKFIISILKNFPQKQHFSQFYRK